MTAPDANGWIAWSAGDKRPDFAPDTKVFVTSEDGHTIGPIEYWSVNWRQHSPVIAYKVMPS